MDMENGDEIKESKKSSVWGWVFGIVILLLFIYIFDWGFLKGEITNYSIAPCPECPTGMMTLNTRTYKPSSSRQEVVSRMSDFGLIDRYTKCAVVDRKNWECKYNDDSGRFGFTNGQYWNDDEEAKRMGWEHVSRFRYLMVYWRNAF